MSNRELAIELINQMPEYKIGYAIAYLQGLSADDNAGASAEEQKKIEGVIHYDRLDTSENRNRQFI